MAGKVLVLVVAVASVAFADHDHAHGDVNSLSCSLGPYPVGNGETPVPNPTGSVTVTEPSADTLKVSYDMTGLAPTLKATISSYPDADVAAPAGSVSVATVDGQLYVYWSLTGLETDATGGIHIHTGTTCDNASLVGGHYYDTNMSEDPWDFLLYTANNEGKASGMYNLSSGYDTYGDNINHAVVVHMANGTRSGCGILQAVGGGIHIHSGTTCDNKTEVGGHYYKTQPDPWTSDYDGSSNGSSIGSVEVSNSGYDLHEVNGHAVVIHSALDGSRIGCCVLQEDAATTTDSSETTTEATGAAKAFASLALILASLAWLF